MTPVEFLNTLWQFKPADQFILIWTLQDKRSHWFRSADAAGQFAAAANGLDVYVGVGLAGKDYGPARRCKSEEVSGICGIGADLDLMSKAHSNKPLPTTIADAVTILPVSMPASIINLSGNGAQAWWLLKEPLIFDSGEERAEAARLVARWHTMLHRNSAERGWAYERLSDLARILRIPGTRNLKDPANPKDVVVHSLNDARYNLSDFAEFLDDSGIPHPEAQENATREWAKQFADKPPLVIDLNARIPQEMLDGWMAADMRFKDTWLRQRRDLKDQSQSGYDLALADFGVAAGLTEQQIVDLIVHHRGPCPRSQRTRLDYFQRTIAKAFQRDPGVEAPAGLPAAPAPGATTGNPASPGAQGAPVDGGMRDTPTPDPNVTKDVLYDRISEALGIRVLRLVKITGKEPTYHMELPEGKIEFASVGKLISQDSVRLAIAGSIGILIHKFKPKAWEYLAQVMLNACIVEQGGEETEWEGAARMYVAQYLSETGFIDTLDGQQVQSQRKPILLDGKVAICASDLQMYVNKTTFQNLSIKTVASMLGVLGGKSIRVRGAKFKEQSRWILPEDQFDPAEYSPRKEETIAR